MSTPVAAAWLQQRRDEAAQRAASLPLPTHKGRAGWEFTELGKDFSLDAWPPVVHGGPLAADVETPLLEVPEDAIRLDQVDGAVVSSPDLAIEDGPVVLPLDVAAERHPELVEPHLGTVVPGEDDLFVAANDASWTGGAFVFIPRGIKVDVPIVLSQVLSAAGAGTYRRVLVVVDEGAEAEVWDQWLTATDEAALLDVVVELKVGDNARLRYVCGQDLNERSWIFGAQRAEVGRDGVLDWVALGFGSANGKVRMETLLAGRGAEGKVTGAYAPHKRQHLEFDTTQEHAAEGTISDLAFRGVLADRSHAVWRGMIKVDQGAQKTDAFQECRNLLLGRKAHADAIPGLEILADDVRCTHAAAVAQIDADQLFYLRSRGLTEARAKRLVIEGFLAELVERFAEGSPSREALATALDRRLQLVLG